MATRLTGKSWGRGNLGYTWAHNRNDSPAYVSKGHPSCGAYGAIDTAQAAAGMVKCNYEETTIEWRNLDAIQDSLMNLGSMIFDSKNANYALSTTKTIKWLEKRLAKIEPELPPTEFVKYGVTQIHATWCWLTTQIRACEVEAVRWLNATPIEEEVIEEYMEMLVLLNLISKWTAAEARYHVVVVKQLKEQTWKADYDKNTN